MSNAEKQINTIIVAVTGTAASINTVALSKKKRDGVNYFYGGSDLPYRHTRHDNSYNPVGVPYQVIQYISYGYPGSCGAKWTKSSQLCCNEKSQLFNPAMGFYNPYPFPETMLVSFLIR